jgi:3-hydroxyisobutyrate dehydrogenase-like beta-hydroxyacid dehydrogenase
MKAGRKKGTVGIVGMGIMGGAFARHLAAGGWRVVGFDVDAGIKRTMARLGVEIAPDVATLAKEVPTILTSLPNPQALDATVAAICAAKLPPKVIVECSTFALDDKMRAESLLKKAGHTAIDCPASGTGAQAAVKDVVFYASGDSKAIAKLKPMFGAFSRAIYDLGPYGNGSKMKYVANLLVAIHNVASAEAMVLGIKSGLDPKQIVELISTGAGTSRMFEMRAPLMARDNYEPPTIKVKVFQKDLDVISGFATKMGVPTPTFSATAPIYAAAQSMGYGMHDTAAVCAVIERMANVKRRKPAKASRRKR